MTVKISKINIKIGKKTISLTPDEAKELREILNDTFGEQKVITRTVWLSSGKSVTATYSLSGASTRGTECL